MIKKLISFVLVAALMASLGGCASIFNKEYFTSTEYEATETDSESSSGGATAVKNYFGLKLEISKLVTAHEESGILDFRQYNGDIYDDIASACKEVGTNTALGAFCVDYISYDIDRIVAYYEAEILISYKRTAEETSKIITISTSNGLYDCVVDSLSDMNESLVVMVNASLAGVDEAAGFVDTACRDDPLICVVKPVVTVNVYSGGGLQKIFEISIDYGGKKADLIAKREELSDTVAELIGNVIAKSDASRAFQAANQVLNNCSSDESAGNTAYDALIGGAADSEGMAMAFRAVCAAAGISCQVISGRMNSEDHYWNIIEADGDWYHVDVSRTMEEGFANTFLLSDTYMWGCYWWDTELYPACEGSQSYSSAVNVQQSA